jgi:hypothetical protein
MFVIIYRHSIPFSVHRRIKRERKTPGKIHFVIKVLRWSTEYVEKKFKKIQSLDPVLVIFFDGLIGPGGFV